MDNGTLVIKQQMAVVKPRQFTTDCKSNKVVALKQQKLK